MTIGSANGGGANEVEDVGAEARTVFVRNVPFTLTDSQLQEVFSEIGPVRRSFIIKEKGAEQHRGFGYVHFAIAGDALRAVKEKDGTLLQGRKVMVKLANRRLSLEQRRMKRQPDKQPNKDRHESLDSPGLEGKAPQKPSTVSANSEKQQKPIQAKSNRRGEAAQGKLTSQHGSKAIQETFKSLGTITTEELKSPFEIEKHELSEANLTNNGDAVHAKNKRKRQHEPGGSRKKKKKEVSDSCKNNLKDEVLEEKKSSEKQRVARTVILGGLVSPEMREAVIERAKKVGSVESIQSSLSPQELKGRGLEKDCKVGAASIVFKSVKAASQAVAELHQKSISNGIVWARQLGGEGAKPKKWRIIIRNLPFSITEEKIRELFSSSGFVWEANVPRKEDGQARGFAFASFTSKANAEKAIHDMNGTRVKKRPIAVDWAVERRAYQPSTSVHLDDKEKLPSDIEEDETASEDEEEVFAKQENFSFEGFENEKAESELLASSEEIDLAKRVLNKVVSAPFTTKPENIESKQTDGDENGCLIPAEELKRSQSERKTIADENQSMQCTSQGDLSKTIFIKNLPFDLDKVTLKRLFSAFGKVKSTYLVLHPKTERPKGSAFLEFLNAESAEAAFVAASGSSTNDQFVAGISLGGRKLEVLKALERKSVAALEKKKLEQNVIDRRNLYLLKEGKIEEGSPSAIGVSEQDMQKRRELAQVKKVKLKSPKFHVSKTRLAIHNVPKSLKELELRKLFLEAVKLRATKQEPVIKQVKILRDEAKGEKSRGVAFVEFTEHQHALVALRVLNNNPGTFGPDRRPIVEFSIENLETLRKRQEQQSAAGKQGRSDSEGNAQLKKPKKGEKEPNSRQIKSNDESKCFEREKGGLNARERGGPGSAVGKPAKARLKKQVKPNVQHMADSSLKRKRQDTSSNEAIENTVKAQSVPNFKRQKLSKGNVKRTGLEESKSKPLSGSSNTRAKVDSNRLKQKTNKAEFVVKEHDLNLGIRSQQKKPMAAKKKKGSKLEVEDKLDKLVVAYRERYFSDKEKKKSTGVTASNDFKRWFE